MRLPDLGQVAIDLADPARIADDAIDRTFRSALAVAGVDEDLEHVVRGQGLRRFGRLARVFRPTG